MQKHLSRSVPVVVLSAVDLLFLLWLLATVGAWVMMPLRISLGPISLVLHWHPRLLAGPVLIVAIRELLKRGARSAGVVGAGLWEKPGFKKVCLALGTTFVFFLALEQALELAGFEAYVPPVVIRGRQGSGVEREKVVIPDRELRWKFNPGKMHYGRTINSLGFREREVDPVKKTGTSRVICMGDSCTGQGDPPYSEILHCMLTNAPPTQSEWEAFNMAVDGYSSVQGLRLLQLRGRQFEPEFVTIMYGWNDHWLGGRMPDSSRMRVGMGPVRGAVFRVLRRKRFGQLLIFIVSPVRTVVAEAERYNTFRVPAHEYEWTLKQFVAEVRGSGAVPILMTAPRGPVMMDDLVKNGQAKSLAAVIEAHDEYVAVTRRVAGETDTPLLDLEDMWTEEEKRELIRTDGIHFYQPGLERIAAELYEIVAKIAGSD